MENKLQYSIHTLRLVKQFLNKAAVIGILINPHFAYSAILQRNLLRYKNKNKTINMNGTLLIKNVELFLFI